MKKYDSDISMLQKLANNKRIGDGIKRKMLKKSFKKVCEKGYRERNDPKKFEQYNLIKNYYIQLNILTEEEVSEIEKQVEEKHNKWVW